MTGLITYCRSIHMIVTLMEISIFFTFKLLLGISYFKTNTQAYFSELYHLYNTEAIFIHCQRCKTSDQSAEREPSQASMTILVRETIQVKGSHQEVGHGLGSLDKYSALGTIFWCTEKDKEKARTPSKHDQFLSSKHNLDSILCKPSAVGQLNSKVKWTAFP